MNENRRGETPIFLTAAGRQRLQDRLAADIAERARLSPVDPTDVRDSGEEADRLEAADQQIQLDERIASTQAALSRALPVPVGPEDGVVRLGATISIRDVQGETMSLTLIDPTEIVGAQESVAVDSPIGAALFGRGVGDRVSVSTPSGEQVFEIIGVQAYRPA